jgi:hypothetical protein
MKQKSLFAAVALILVLVLISSDCSAGIFGKKGNGKITEQTRKVSDFNNVVINGFGTIYLSQGSENSLKIETDENLVQFIKAENKETSLILSSEKRIDPTKLIFHITMKDIKGFKISGAGDLIGKTPIKTSDLLLKIEGSGDINLNNVDIGKTIIKVGGSGKCVMTGKSGDVELKISGSGKMILGELEANNVKTEISGSGDCAVWAKDKLDVKISGSGDVKYKGEPKDIKTKTTGSGTVSKIN